RVVGHVVVDHHVDDAGAAEVDEAVDQGDEVVADAARRAEQGRQVAHRRMGDGVHPEVEVGDLEVVGDVDLVEHAARAVVGDREVRVGVAGVGDHRIGAAAGADAHREVDRGGAEVRGGAEGEGDGAAAGDRGGQLDGEGVAGRRALGRDRAVGRAGVGDGDAGGRGGQRRGGGNHRLGGAAPRVGELDGQQDRLARI